VPKYVKLYNGRCLGVEGNPITIQQALGKKFRYAELMAGRMTEPPHSSQAEWSVVGAMLHTQEKCSEVIGAQLEPDDFFRIDTRMIFEGAVETFYADERVDAVSVGERKRAALAAAWKCDESEVASKLQSFTNSYAVQPVGRAARRAGAPLRRQPQAPRARAVHDPRDRPEREVAPGDR
jgi:hypothetical protein